jgi:hypothetical protein
MWDSSSGDKLKIALFGDLSLEEAMNLLRDRQILELEMFGAVIPIPSAAKLYKGYKRTRPSEPSSNFSKNVGSLWWQLLLLGNGIRVMSFGDSLGTDQKKRPSLLRTRATPDRLTVGHNVTQIRAVSFRDCLGTGRKENTTFAQQRVRRTDSNSK